MTHEQLTLPGFDLFDIAALCGPSGSLCQTCPSAGLCHPPTSSEDADPITDDEAAHRSEVEG